MKKLKDTAMIAVWLGMINIELGKNDLGCNVLAKTSLYSLDEINRSKIMLKGNPVADK